MGGWVLRMFTFFFEPSDSEGCFFFECLASGGPPTPRADLDEYLAFWVPSDSEGVCFLATVWRFEATVAWVWRPFDVFEPSDPEGLGRASPALAHFGWSQARARFSPRPPLNKI